MKVLLVDDSGLSRKVQAKVLREMGLGEIIEAKDGLEALRLLEQLDYQVDLLLTDWNMPGLDGVSLMGKVRQHPRGRTLPVIVISSEFQEQRIGQALQAGAHSYVTKPFKKEVLARRIASARTLAELERRRTDPAEDSPALEGDLERMGFAELVGFLNFSRRSGELLFELESGEAGVAFKDGDVIDAWIGRFASEDAFFAIARLGRGRFRFHDELPSRSPRITKPTLALLMDAVRSQDEAEAHG